MTTAIENTREARPPAAVKSDIVGGRPEALSLAASRFIHFARWVAATMVLLHHVSATFVSVPDIMTAPHNPLVYVWWFFTPFTFAHEAVIVFFVLSGFLVGGAVLGRRAKPAPWLAGYFIDRITRIYIVFLPVIALTLILDASGRKLFAAANLYDLAFLDGRYDPGLILPNLASLQGLWFEPIGTNLPLWSLGMEVWFYILFPLLLLPWLRAYPAHWLRVLGLAAALVFLFSLPTGNYMPFGFAIWALGAFARVVARPLFRSKWLALALFVIGSVVIRLAVREHFLNQPPVKYLRRRDGGAALRQSPRHAPLRYGRRFPLLESRLAREARELFLSRSTPSTCRSCSGSRGPSGLPSARAGVSNMRRRCIMPSPSPSSPSFSSRATACRC